MFLWYTMRRNVHKKEDNMQDELVKLVADKAGITEAQANTAVETVMGFIQDQLPEPWGSQIGAALDGDLAGLTGSASGLLGGLFGNK
jgi:uncharacterized protein (DUF2267 family)